VVAQLSNASGRSRLGHHAQHTDNAQRKEYVRRLIWILLVELVKEPPRLVVLVMMAINARPMTFVAMSEHWEVVSLCVEALPQLIHAMTTILARLGTFASMTTLQTQSKGLAKALASPECLAMTAAIALFRADV
jgi:hypothetical protein